MEALPEVGSFHMTSPRRLLHFLMRVVREPYGRLRTYKPPVKGFENKQKPSGRDDQVRLLLPELRVLRSEPRGPNTP